MGLKRHERQSHAGDAALIQRVRGHLHGDVTHTGVTELAQGAVQCHYIKGRVRGWCDRWWPAHAQRAEIRTVDAAADRVQPRAGGLAIGPCDSRNLQLRRRAAVKAVGEFAEAGGKPGNGDRRDRRRQARRRLDVVRIPQHGDGAARDRCRDVLESVRAPSGDGNEGIARLDLAAVEHESAHGHPRRGDAPLQQPG